MAAQSRPAILITRPAEGGARFARALRRRLGPGLRIICAPLMAPRWLSPPLPPLLVGGRAEAVVFSSEAGVAGFARLWPGRDLPAFCVGARTAAAARRAGFAAEVAGRDAAGLIATLGAAAPRRLIVVRGEHVAADICGALGTAGLEVAEVVVYSQIARPLPARARALLDGAGPVVLAVFSARSGALLAEAVAGARAPLRVAAISPGAAEPLLRLAPEAARCAASPDAAAMLEAVAALVARG
jgi:uroporphyrinogen-III synthase